MCVLFNTQEAAQVLLLTLFLVATPFHSLFDPFTLIFHSSHARFVLCEPQAYSGRGRP